MECVYVRVCDPIRTYDSTWANRRGDGEIVIVRMCVCVPVRAVISTMTVISA